MRWESLKLKSLQFASLWWYCDVILQEKTVAINYIYMRHDLWQSTLRWICPCIYITIDKNPSSQLPSYAQYFYDSKTSLYTIFLVFLPDGLARILGLAKTHVVLRATPLDNATYSWPWENAFSGRYNLEWFEFALLIVIAKLSLVGTTSSSTWMVVSHLQKKKENLLASMLAVRNININWIVTKTHNNQTGSIAKTIVWSRLRSRITWQFFLDSELMRWQGIRSDRI
jgi:hypothetical protein